MSEQQKLAPKGLKKKRRQRRFGQLRRPHRTKSGPTWTVRAGWESAVANIGAAGRRP